MIQLFIIKTFLIFSLRILIKYLGNTLLVDNMPYKTCQNPPLNDIFVESYDDVKKKDNYFLGTFLPYLESLHYSRLSVRTFVEDYTFGSIRSLNKNDVKFQTLFEKCTIAYNVT